MAQALKTSAERRYRDHLKAQAQHDDMQQEFRSQRRLRALTPIEKVLATSANDDIDFSAPHSWVHEGMPDCDAVTKQRIREGHVMGYQRGLRPQLGRDGAPELKESFLINMDARLTLAKQSRSVHSPQVDFTEAWHRLEQWGTHYGHVIVLVVHDGLTQEQAGVVMGVTQPTITAWLHKGLMHLWQWTGGAVPADIHDYYRSHCHRSITHISNKKH